MFLQFALDIDDPLTIDTPLIYRIYLSQERMVIYLQKTEPLHPRIISARFGLNLFNGSGEDFQMRSWYFQTIFLYPSL